MPEYEIEDVCKSYKTQAARTTIGMNRILIVGLIWGLGAVGVLRADLDYTVSWVGNSFSGADDKWVQNFFIHMVTQPDGVQVGSFDPGPTLGGVENTGWIDVMTGIIAYKRDNGEYLICVEEDYKAKSIIYRWRP